MKFCKKFTKYFFLLSLGGLIYYDIELLYRGYSHLSMFLVGGLCFISIGLINEFFDWDMYIEKQVIIGTFDVLLIELISGIILNMWLKLNIWDYSNLPFNILGQICLPFALLWIPLVLFAIFVDDYFRYIFFDEEKPKYKSWVYEKIKKIIK